MPKMLVVDAARCMACKSCMLACAMVHSEATTLAEAIQAEVPPQARGHVEPFGRFGMLVQCRHCEDAPCMTICPADAIYRAGPDGPLVIDQGRCTGCRFCLIVCPSGSIDRARSGKTMIKCDLCITRTEAGEDPACVSACPTHGLQFRELDEWLKQQRREVAAQLASEDDSCRPEIYPIGQLPSTEGVPPREAATSKATAKVLPCEVCGRPVAPVKLFEHIRAKLPEHVTVQPICEKCRRSRTVLSWSEITRPEPSGGNTEPVGK